MARLAADARTSTSVSMSTAAVTPSQRCRRRPGPSASRRVTFHGRIPIEEVPAAVAAADIGLAPRGATVHRHEPLHEDVRVRRDGKAGRRVAAADGRAHVSARYRRDVRSGRRPHGGRDRGLRGRRGRARGGGGSDAAIVEAASWEHEARGYVGLVEAMIQRRSAHGHRASRRRWPMAAAARRRRVGQTPAPPPKRWARPTCGPERPASGARAASAGCRKSGSAVSPGRGHQFALVVRHRSGRRTEEMRLGGLRSLRRLSCVASSRPASRSTH